MPAGNGNADAAGASAPAAVPAPSDAQAAPPPVAVSKKLAQEIEALEASIAADQVRLEELRFRANFQEFPKMVKGHVFNSRAEQDAAGPEFADA